MGQKVSVPKAGAEIQVIGAGLPRTGTASFSAALEILLDGPTYHGGTQISRAHLSKSNHGSKLYSTGSKETHPVASRCRKSCGSV
jgi:hypothetical protein